MQSIKFICVQPRLVYYAWQLEVMLNNFLKHGIQGQDIDILVAYSPEQNDRTNHDDVVALYTQLIRKFNTVKFYFYKDTRVAPCYISSIRPNILKQHFKNFPELKLRPIFYHDCDVVLTKKPDLEPFLNGSNWYLSDTISYIGANYIKSKGDDIYNKMCEIVGINPEIPTSNESSSGGAQYLMKGVDEAFWEKVEKDAESLYRYFLEDEPKKMAMNPSYHPIQKWTSDMWAVLWNAWYFGHSTKIHPYFNFTWATDPIERWDQNFIFHNAGVVGPGELFYKGDYINTLPYYLNGEGLNKNMASYNYFQEIMQSKVNSCLISN